jgi:hypothetical protein
MRPISASASPRSPVRAICRRGDVPDRDGQ